MPAFRGQSSGHIRRASGRANLHAWSKQKKRLGLYGPSQFASCRDDSHQEYADKTIVERGPTRKWALHEWVLQGHEARENDRTHQQMLFVRRSVQQIRFAGEFRFLVRYRIPNALRASWVSSASCTGQNRFDLSTRSARDRRLLEHSPLSQS